MKLSIIVPVYNVEKYIVKCISSLLNQNYDDYEIIIIDDGSPDNSIKKLTETVSDKKIVIKHQKNGGLSVARNSGLEIARGEYVWFFDSDDWASENCLLDIINYLRGCDILYFTKSYNVSNLGSSIIAKNNHEFSGKELSKKDYFNGAPFYIYRRRFLVDNNLKFEPNLFHEDAMFTPIVLYSANKVVPYDNPAYHRLQHEGSITHTVNPKRCYDLMTIIEHHIDFALNNVSEGDRFQWGNCIANLLNSILRISQDCDSKVIDDVDAFIISHSEALEYLIHSRKLPSRILGLAIKYTTIPPSIIYKFLRKIRY